MKAYNLTDKTFCELTVLHPYPKSDKHGRYWVCQCSCGQEIAVRASNLVSGHSKSCGCRTRFRKET
jgi:hypothetical protein